MKTAKNFQILWDGTTDPFTQKEYLRTAFSESVCYVICWNGDCIQLEFADGSEWDVVIPAYMVQEFSMRKTT